MVSQIVLSMTPTRKHFSESNLLIAGTARDIAHCIDQEIRHLLSCTKQFQSTQVLIIESDSSDKTVEHLHNLKTEIKDFDFISLGQLGLTISSRTQRLSVCRNEIIKAVREDPKYQDIDYVLLADLDGVNTLLTPEKIAQCWSVKEDWSVICANQLNYYYDIWALRHPFWNPHNYLEQYQQLEPWMGPHQAHQIAIATKQIQLPTNQGLIPVDSAFGGLAIYTKQAYISGMYDYSHTEIEDTEHVPFHQSLKKNGFKIFINSALINCAEPTPNPGQKIKKRYVLKAIRSFGNVVMGKKRFDKYLSILKTL
jgi:hypothetical protein